MSRFLSVLGIVCTCVYLALLAVLFHGRFAEVIAMSPNNIGDFLAGVFGPLAILWLILGFFQQGVELRQNTRVLELQAGELRNSVEQQKRLVDVSRQQVAAELEVIRFERERQLESARPKFVFHGVGASFGGQGGRYTSRIKNIGNTATEIEFSFDPPMKRSTLTTIVSWSRGEEHQIEWAYHTNTAEASSLLTMSYIDAMGQAGTQQFEFLPIKSGPNAMVEIVPRRG